MSGNCSGGGITPEMADTFRSLTGGTLGAVAPGESVILVGEALTAKSASSALRKMRYRGQNFKVDDFVLADAMNSKQFRKLVKDIAQNGLKNPIIEYVVKDGVPHVTFGSNRLSAARYLRIINQLKFVEKTVPTRGYETLDDVVRVPSPRFRGPPVTMQAN